MELEREMGKLEDKDARFKDVNFREGQFRMLEPLLVPLLGEEGTTELVFNCPEVLTMDASKLRILVLLVSLEEREVMDVVKTTPEMLVLTDEEIERMKIKRTRKYKKQKKEVEKKAREALTKLSQTMQNVASKSKGDSYGKAPGMGGQKAEREICRARKFERHVHREWGILSLGFGIYGAVPIDVDRF